MAGTFTGTFSLVPLNPSPVQDILIPSGNAYRCRITNLGPGGITVFQGGAGLTGLKPGSSIDVVTTTAILGVQADQNAAAVGLYELLPVTVA